MELNGYFFRKLLVKTRRRFALGAGEQALYHELVDICNEEDWRTSFQVSNGELMTALQCTEATLRTWRQQLIGAGLINYKSGKSKKAFGWYELVIKINPNPNPKAAPNPIPNPAPNGEDSIKLNQTKLTEVERQLKFLCAFLPEDDIQQQAKMLINKYGNVELENLKPIVNAWAARIPKHAGKKTPNEYV